MLIGTQPGEAYTDDEGRMYYDTEDGETYRTNKDGRGLYRWVQRGSSAGWKQWLGDSQLHSLTLEQFADRMRATDTDEGA